MQAAARGKAARDAYMQLKPPREWRFVKKHRRIVNTDEEGGGHAIFIVLTNLLTHLLTYLLPLTTYLAIFIVQKHERRQTRNRGPAEELSARPAAPASHLAPACTLRGASAAS